MPDPNWAEQVTANATAIGAIDCCGRWDEDALVEAGQLVAQFRDANELRDAFAQFVEPNTPQRIRALSRARWLLATSAANIGHESAASIASTRSNSDLT